MIEIHLMLVHLA